jgi:predicted metal-dependent phosphoesterase TrpH
MITPTQCIERALAAGIEGICLTEHDRMWDPEALEQLRLDVRLRIFGAVELTTEKGHILAYGLVKMPDAPGIFASVAKAAGEQSALLFLAHPLRDGLTRLDDELRMALTSVEAINGSDSALKDNAAIVVARSLGAPGIAGSDAHSSHEVGKAATEFVDAIDSDEALVAALKAGHYAPLRLAR